MIPPLPTDNLYKFTAFGGIILMGFCFWTLRDSSLRLDEALTKFNSASGNYDVVSSVFDADVEQLKQLVGRAQDAVTEAEKPENADNIVTAKMAIEAFDELKTFYERTRQQLPELRKAQAEFKLQNLEFKTRLDRLDDNLDFLVWVLFGGAALTASGVWSWYSRHQRYQDELLHIQLESAKKALASASTSPEGQAK